VVTADAMHCQKDHADYLVLQRGAHYILTVKGNHCAARRFVVYPTQLGGIRGEISGSDGLPGSEMVKGTIACQQTGGQVQASGMTRRGTRVIWRKLHCLNPNLQRMHFTSIGTTPETDARRALSVLVRQRNPRDEERCPVRVLKKMSGAPKSR
jgi:hypothetical protein